MIGIIKWYDNKKGYGFIKTEDREVFLHRSQIDKDIVNKLSAGDKVEFDLYEVGDKYEARSVKKA